MLHLLKSNYALKKINNEIVLDIEKGVVEHDGTIKETDVLLDHTKVLLQK